MKRKLAGAGLVLAAIAALLMWRCNSGASTRTSASAAKHVGGKGATSARDRVDPRTQKRATIAGTITNEERAVVPRARVCADIETRHISPELLREPRCTFADDQGRYKIGELFAAEYSVAAAAKPYRPGVFHPGGDRDEMKFALAPGENKNGVDIVLRTGGVEITGTVSDVTGGPIARAQVSARRGWWSREYSPSVETDDDGKFSLWVKPGQTTVTAAAEGYTNGSDSGNAPGAYEILLTPESSLAGTVVDAKTGQPVAGVPVNVAEGEWGFFGSMNESGDITDDAGKFRVTRLGPGRYVANARSSHGYGRSEGSTLVGLGQHVDGVVVKLHPGYQVRGKVVLPDKSTCKKANFELSDSERDRSVYAIRELDGELHADGVLPGKYRVSVSCEGYQSKDKYPELEVKDKDQTGLVWEVDRGAILRGKVVTKKGEPIEDANVSARSVGGAARAKTDWGGDQSEKDGSFKLEGLKAGTFKIDVSHDLYNGEKDGWKIDVAAGATIDKDFVLDDGAMMKGVVVDSQGKPVGGVNVNTEALGGRWWSSGVRTKPDGTFQVEGMRPGEYRVRAHRGWWSDELRKPGSTDDDKQGEKVTVALGKVANVKLVVESQSGVITGTVVDSAGKPVSDAYISAARESDAAGARGSTVERTRWSWDEKPVISNVDGKFKLEKLSPGKYTLRAFRKGGGEAVAEHVAIGGTAKLQIRATGIIEGVVKRGSGTAEEIKVALADAKTGFHRSETFFRTDGKYIIRDLPQGAFTMTVEAEGGKKQLDVQLAEGQHKTGVDVTLDDLVNITGRVIELTTKQPVAGMRMMAAIGKRGGGGFSFRSDNDDQPNISDDSGRFTIENAPRGAVTIRGFPKDFGESDYGWVMTLRDVSGTGTVDIGDVTVLKRRVKRGDVAGELGVKWVEAGDEVDIDKHKFEVSYIDPKGPAAKTELKVGDIVTSVDGVDITGINASNGWLMMRAAPGTALKLGLARGATVTVVLAAP